MSSSGHDGSERDGMNERVRLTPGAFDRLLDAARPDEDLARHAPRARADVPEAVDRYTLLREVGQGGMGVVYEAEDTELGRRVALKLLRERLTASSDAWERFQREARTVARLSHSNIAAIYEARDRYIAMQFVDGETLATVPRDDVRQLVRCVRDAARAVHYAHERGIVHRDLKPHNLMIDSAGRLFVMDFGLAKRTAVDSSLSTSGHILGTPSYMAPEQARGDVRAVDARTDVYALGATLYDLIAGHPPFDEEEVYKLLKRVVEDDPPSLRNVRPTLDPDVDTIVQRCLEKDPSRRYTSAGSLADDLDRWLEHRPIEARRPSRTYRLRKFIARRKALVGVAALGILGVAVAIVLLLPELLAERDRRTAASRALVLWGRLSSLMADAEIYRRGGDIAESNERLDRGIAECEAAIAQEEMADAYYFLGRLHHAKGDSERARDALDAALGLNPELGEAHYQRGIVLAEMYASGLSMDRERFAAERSDPRPPMYDVAHLEQMFPHLRWIHDLAVRDLSVEVGLSSYFKQVDGIYGKAELARIRGDRDLAIASLDRVIEQEPMYVPAWISRASLALADGRWSDAIDDATEAIERHEGMSAAFVVRSVARLWQSDEFESALERRHARTAALTDANRAVELDPGSAEAHLVVGNCHFDFEDFDGAIEAYGRAIARDPRRAHAFSNRGLARLRKGAESEQLEAAIADFHEATLVNHQLPAPHYRLARALARRSAEQEDAGKSESAVLMRARALESVECALEHAEVASPLRSKAEELRRQLAKGQDPGVR